MDLHEKRIKLEDIDMLSILGYNDEYLHLIENKFESIITARGNTIILRGKPQEIKTIETVFNEIIYILKRNGSLNAKDVSTVLELIQSSAQASQLQTTSDNNIVYYGIKEPIRARTKKQIDYYKKVLENDLVFAIGPAGTGKTYLAVAMALSALKKNEVSKIILSRPAVEAGESLGFLPGDLKEKLDPYIKPLTDALFDMIPPDKLKSYMEKNIIEIIPLAYMRGRTLSNSFIILDEAQNATITQMKMFLTRMGHNSKAIVTGDITQIDLLSKKDSGLINARNILKNIPSIDFIYFDNKDVVRHKLVADIIKAYEREAKEKEEKK
ncbi:MAG TPA: PhoH family protein [Candidatus Kapabacteria bacterium]|nr:PhoH family protein [Candidatus Kapabacteria bacterium]HPO62684.1 PhoH family protein [Candidatus Kapabacteria bacterium]